MELTSAKEQRRTRTYDSDIAQYTSYLNENIKGISAHNGELLIPRNEGQDKIPCVSIDNIVGLPEKYRVDIVPKKRDGEYYLDFIIYTTGKEEDKFCPIIGGDRAKVEFGNDIKSAIYAILVGKKEIEDLTLVPFKPKKRGGDNYGAILERRDKVHQRYLENRGNFWLYYTSNLGGSPAFVVHMPKDPYQAVPLLKKWLESIQKIGNR